ncbi:DEAD/DEAH box helicase [Pseudomonas amygdali]|uniref:Transcription-repair-coupling factor n=1 Tax=Pseudomonas amygdali pv. lachrymans str. M301315 TaxID=629260 RepID=A0AAD0PX41_PSEAV|nr:DEAD/DEAH box helicase [Pseudomonas amygdali]AXH60375.1 transcription-repair coupling protein Mfd [Pseudomonas amygdali pv. lachrymans str. M301315]RMT08685.1 Transcription-repair coupling protein Mfd [Pseudomonas amygdali pv. lachrymans]
MQWLNITGSAKALVYGEHLRLSGGIVVTRFESEASTIASEIPFFHPDLADRIIYLPDSEVLPYDLESAPASIKSERAQGIRRLMLGIENPILVISASNLMQPVASKKFWLEEHLDIRAGQKLPVGLIEKLTAWGYKESFRVKAPASWSTRGRIFDLYPVGMAHTNNKPLHCAVRIRLDADQTIRSISQLDSLTQDSSGQIQSLEVFPTRDYEFGQPLINLFRQRVFDVHDHPRDQETYKAISKGSDHPELFTWSLLSEMGVQPLPEVIGKGVTIFDEGAYDAVNEHWALILRRHEDVKADLTRMVPNPQDAWLSPESLVDIMEPFEKHILLKDPAPGSHDLHYVASGFQRKGVLSEALGMLKEVIASGLPLLFVVKSDVRRNHLSVMCRMLGLGVKVEPVSDFKHFLESGVRLGITAGEMEQGYLLDGQYRVISEREIFGAAIESSLDDEIGEHHRRVILQGLHEIQIGEPLVHAIKGVGRFQGFESINMGDGLEDLVKIGYAEDSSSYIKINDLDLVSRYSGGNPEKAPLSKLNDPTWLQSLKEAQVSALSVAKDLITLRTARERSTGVILKPAGDSYDRFAETFAYDETADQKKAIADIMSDLTSGKPMDRLICGDVGFGKTEVAMRAAFMMADQGYQVAVLAPTTLLAQQHYSTFCSRFEETPHKVMLANKNTFSALERKQLSKGDVQIVIGTHRLLQGDINFRNLGLIIVDEEHLFGVKQKEQLRTVRGNKHLLSMAATPIPRTLGMAISGIRDMSIIATPPARRLSVRTLLREQNDRVIQEAVQREMSRSGQVFYLHNRIGSMPDCVKHLQSLIPNARIAMVHGDMREDEMFDIMLAFRNREYDILVGTTVIEIGIDVPNANTLIVEKADALGLGQLHQLRGRVGRSTRQAYAYLLSNVSTGVANMRLKAMEAATNLGEGFVIARHDMEIRGIGEILGEEQSGHVHRIGFALYMRLLEQAIKALDDERASPGYDLELATIMSSVQIPRRGFIPSTFIAETGERLAWYQRLMCSDSVEELKTNLRELEDLYGYLAPEVAEFAEWVAEAISLKSLQIGKVEQDGSDVLVTLTHGHLTRASQAVMALTFESDFVVGEKSNQFKVLGYSIPKFAQAIVQATAH